MYVKILIFKKNENKLKLNININIIIVYPGWGYIPVQHPFGDICNTYWTIC